MDKETTIKAIIEKIKLENDGNHIDFVIPGYAAKRLVAYQSMREDILLCKESLSRIMGGFDEVVTLSLYHTFIILYGKCFVKPTHIKSPKLETKDCFTENDAELFQVHKEIIELRHNYTAHRGSTENEIGFAFLKLNIEDLTRHVRVKQIKRRMPKTEDLPKYLKLFDHLIGIVESKFQREANKVWDQMLEQFKPEELAMFKIAEPTIETKC